MASHSISGSLVLWLGYANTAIGMMIIKSMMLMMPQRQSYNILYTFARFMLIVCMPSAHRVCIAM